MLAVRRIAILCSTCATAVLLCGGCTVVSVAGTAVSLGVTAGSAAVGVAATVVKGTVSAGGAVVGAVTD